MRAEDGEGSGGRRMQHVAVVGGGFGGAVLAMELVRADPLVRVSVIEPRPLPGAGLAYSTPDTAHRINVPSTRMSCDPDNRGDFAAWLQERRESEVVDAVAAATLEDGRCFPPRLLFGRYVADRLARAQRASGRIAVVRDHAIAVRPAGPAFRVVLAGGETLTADQVVLAASHPAPHPPASLAAIAGQPGFVADPWCDGGLPPLDADARVLIVGTALSMADVVATLNTRGHRGPITALSRRGLASRGHACGGQATYGDFTTDPARTAAGLLRRVRENVNLAGLLGLPWQAVLDAVRAQGVSVWQALPLAEQRRLVRHLRPWWDVHRFRVAPPTGAVLEKMQQSGQLRLRAGRLCGARHEGGAFTVRVRGRGDRPEAEETFDAVVLTTGPAHGRLFHDDPVLAGLAGAGLAGPDPVGLGVHVDAESRVLDRAGQPVGGLFVVGPLARGHFGELMGAPEVAAHARFVAGAVLGRNAGRFSGPATAAACPAMAAG